MAVPDDLEAERKKDVPAEARRAGDGFAISQRTRRDGAADRAVRPLRRARIRHHPGEFNHRGNTWLRPRMHSAGSAPLAPARGGRTLSDAHGGSLCPHGPITAWSLELRSAS